MYDVLRKSLVSYVTENCLPFGLLADKMTARHRKRHIMGIRVPIWDVNNSKINQDIYIRHSAVGVGSGEKLGGFWYSVTIRTTIFSWFGNGWAIYLIECGFPHAKYLA